MQAASTFSIIHFNARSVSANFNKLKSVLSSFDFTFDVIAVSETWLNNDDLDSVHMDDYIHRLADLIVAGVELHCMLTDYYSQNLYHSCLNVLLTVLKLICTEIIIPNGKNIVVAFVYRAPNTDLSMIIKLLNIFLTNVKTKRSTCVAILMWIY